MELELFGIQSSTECVDASKKILHVIKHGWCNHRTYMPRQGTIVWAQICGYPSWPAIIEADPDSKIFCRRLDGNVKYHVTFLDKVVTRAWIGQESLSPFTAEDELPVLRKKRGNLDLNLKMAFENAKRALSMDVEERLNTFGFANCYPLQSTSGNDIEKFYTDRNIAMQSDTIQSMEPCRSVNIVNHSAAVEVGKENVSLSPVSKELSSIENGDERVEDFSPQPKRFRKEEIKGEMKEVVNVKEGVTTKKKGRPKKGSKAKNKKKNKVKNKKEIQDEKTEESVEIKSTVVLRKKIDYKLYKMGCDFNYYLR